MKLFLDTAEFDEIKQGVDWRVIDGVTTNPTLIAKAGQDHKTQVKKICGIVDSVSVEVVSEKKDDILVAGRRRILVRRPGADGTITTIALPYMGAGDRYGFALGELDLPAAGGTKSVDRSVTSSPVSVRATATVSVVRGGH